MSVLRVLPYEDFEEIGNLISQYLGPSPLIDRRYFSKYAALSR